MKTLMQYGYALVGISENEYFEYNLKDSFEALIKKYGKEYVYIIWVGSDLLLQDICDDIGLNINNVKVLGVDIKKLEPLSFWLLLIEIVYFKKGQVTSFYCYNRKLYDTKQPYEAEYTDCLRFYEVLKKLANTNGKISSEFIENNIQFNNLLCSIRIPAVLVDFTKSVREYLDLINSLIDSFYIEVNAKTWGEAYKSLYNWDGPLSSNISLLEKLKTKESNIFCKEQYRQSTHKALERLSANTVTSRRHDYISLLIARLTDLSALSKVRADVYLHKKQYTVAYLMYWRSLDIYAYSLALESGILDIDRTGHWMWGKMVDNRDQISTYNIFNELAAVGCPIGPSDQPKAIEYIAQFRKLRNQSSMIHGLLGFNYDATIIARDLTRKSIIEHDRVRENRWIATEKDLDKIMSAEHLPHVILNKIANLDEAFLNIANSK